MMEWDQEVGQSNRTVAILKDGNKVVVKIYLSPDGNIIRFVLPELTVVQQIRIRTQERIIDFARKE